MADLAIEILGLKFAYRGAKENVLDVPTLRVERGERVFLYGPSGSGKSTLLEILAGVLVPQMGQVRILGKNLVEIPAHERDLFRAAHVGYVFQSFNLIPYLNVWENITLPLALSRERAARVSNVRREVIHLLERLQILKLKKKAVHQLSVGQQQRVALARALLGKPEAIFADEPTSSLDFDRREKFLQLLFEVCREYRSTLIFVSHDRSLESQFSRVIAFPEMNLASHAGSVE